MGDPNPNPLGDRIFAERLEEIAAAIVAGERAPGMLSLCKRTGIDVRVLQASDMPFGGVANVCWDARREAYVGQISEELAAEPTKTRRRAALAWMVASVALSDKATRRPLGGPYFFDIEKRLARALLMPHATFEELLAQGQSTAELARAFDVNEDDVRDRQRDLAAISDRSDTREAAHA